MLSSISRYFWGEACDEAEKLPQIEEIEDWVVVGNTAGATFKDDVKDQLENGTNQWIGSKTQMQNLMFGNTPKDLHKKSPFINQHHWLGRPHQNRHRQSLNFRANKNLKQC